jgi:hypothetical protein
MFKYRVEVDFREIVDLHHIFRRFLFQRLAKTGDFRELALERRLEMLLDIPRNQSS